jgi:hypothetical protein
VTLTRQASRAGPTNFVAEVHWRRRAIIGSTFVASPKIFDATIPSTAPRASRFAARYDRAAAKKSPPHKATKDTKRKLRVLCVLVGHVDPTARTTAPTRLTPRARAPPNGQRDAPETRNPPSACAHAPSRRTSPCAAGKKSPPHKATKDTKRKLRVLSVLVVHFDPTARTTAPPASPHAPASHQTGNETPPRLATRQLLAPTPSRA